MRQMSLDWLEPVPINYESSDLPPSVKELRPAVFFDGDAYCCILGPDPQAGIFGSGNDEKSALVDWDKDLKQRLSIGSENDEVVDFVRSHMHAAH